MKVIRAHDGVAFEFAQAHLEGVHEIQEFLETLAPGIGVAPDNMIIMSPSGAQLNSALLTKVLSSLSDSRSQDLAPTPPNGEDGGSGRLQSLFVFDRQFIGMGGVEAVAALAQVPEEAMEPHLPHYDPSQHSDEEAATFAAAHLRAAHAHYDTSLNLLSHVRCQKAALEVALSNLDKCAEQPRGAFAAFEVFARPLVDGYGSLLDAYAPGLALARKVRVLPGLLGSGTGAIGSATGSGKIKYMGDYVMDDKISQVRDRCARVYDDLQTRFNTVRSKDSDIGSRIADIHDSLLSTGADLDDLVELERDAEDGYARVEEVISGVQQLGIGDKEKRLEFFEELVLLDEDARERVACLVERKTFWIQYLIDTLSQISDMQGIVPTIGDDVRLLDQDLRTRTDSFKHLARLKDLVTAYASTVVEVVRRREFTRHLLDHSAALANLLSKLSSDERKRRATYRSDYGGKMPFEVKGMDDSAVPVVEAEVRMPGTGLRPKDPGRPGTEDLPNLTRADVDELVAMLRQIEEVAPDDMYPDIALAKGPAREVRMLVERLMARLEAMETAFADAAERTVMYDSEHLNPPEPPTPGEDVAELKLKLQQLQTAEAELKSQLELERAQQDTARNRVHEEAANEAEVLKAQLKAVREELEMDRAAAVQREQDWKAESERQNDIVDSVTVQLLQVKDQVADKARAIQEVERQLTSARATAEDATRELHELEARHKDHLSDHSTLGWSLQQARERTARLEHDLTGLQAEHGKLLDALSDKDRTLRDHRSETEADMAVLGNQLNGLKVQVESKDREMARQEARIRELENALVRTQRTADSAVDEAVAELRASYAASTADSNAKISALESKSRSALLAAQRLRNTNNNLLAKLAAMPPPGSSHRANGTTEVGALSSLQTIAEDGEIPPPLSDAFDQLIASVSVVEGDMFAPTVQKKVESLSLQVRKWMKESKGYRERAQKAQEQARVKISFRNFAQEDLALFLPTRISTAQIWAAFNVSFPHYFLKPTDKISNLMRTREWLVARIKSLTSMVADSSVRIALLHCFPPMQFAY